VGILRTCILCGCEIEAHLDRCHVKDKAEFSEDEVANKFDRHMNLIDLCRKHHDLFDERRGGGALGIADFGSSEQLTFIRWKHCGDGFCSAEPIEPLRRMDLIEWGGDGNTINPYYLTWKNENTNCPDVKDFCSKIPPGFDFKECENRQN
jgi:hypothetical protein